MNFWNWLRTKINPLPDSLYGIGEQDVVVSSNPGLVGTYQVNFEEGITQLVPEGWLSYNDITNADGLEDQYSARAFIGKRTAAGGLTVFLHNGVTGIDGSWGYSQVVDLDPGCYLLKVSGHGWINDPPHGANFLIAGYLYEALLSKQKLPMQKQFQLIYPFQIDKSGDYLIRFVIQALWATAGHGSMVDVLSAAVLAVDEGYCK